MKNTDRCAIHQRRSNRLINSIKKASELENSIKVVVSKDVYRVMTAKVDVDIFKRYCPSIEGAVPAFHHSTKNLIKLFKAACQIYRQTHHLKQRKFLY